MNLKNYKWGYLTAVILFAAAPLLYWADMHIPGPPDWNASPGLVIGWFILFLLAGIGVLFRKSFGWYVCYAALGLHGAIMFCLGVAFQFQSPTLQIDQDSILGLILLIVGLGLLVMIPIQRRYWRQHQGKSIGNFNRHLLYVLGSLPSILFIMFFLIFIYDRRLYNLVS